MATPSHRVEFRLLGPFEMLVDGRSVTVGPPKHRVLLAALLLHAARPVPIWHLADLLWGDDPPGNPRRGVQLYVTRLRRIFATLAPGIGIVTSADSYQLDAGTDQIDLGRFVTCLERADRAAEVGDLDGEVAALTEGLTQWRGEPLAGLPSDRLQREFASHLREQWLQVVERRFDVELRRGRHADVVGELRASTSRNPLRERLWAQLMTALHRSGRRTDALDAYHTVRRSLADELGIDPGEDLQHLYAQILTGGPQPSSTARMPPVPRQLPQDVSGFVGRAEELVQLDGLLTKQSPLVSVIAGTAGIGKTALATHWARSVADRFPDGQLWVNLRGFDPGQAVTPGQALTRFLRALGTPDAGIPLDVDEQAGLYRSLMDGRRMLVVLDNAATPTQVGPLLPGAPGCLVVITSRNQLSGLVAAADARPLMLDLLNHAEARQLLARRLGTGRVQAEPAAVAEIVDLCARLPLALAIVAARAAVRPEFDLDVLATELRATRGSLDAFAGTDPATEVRSVFSWSYRSVSGAAKRLFRLLGLHPGPDIATAAVASLAGLTVKQTRPLLLELNKAHLITEHVAGRYAFHDLMRAYATEMGDAEDGPAAGREALHRMLDHYLHTAWAAAQPLSATEPIAAPATRARADVTVDDFADHRQALCWFTTEHHVLLATVELAARCGFPIHAQRLALTLAEHLFRSGAWHDWIRVLPAALDAVIRSGDRAEQAPLHRGLARAYARLGQMDPAVDHGRLALDLSAEYEDEVGLAWSHRVFGIVLERQGRVSEALSHDRRALELFQAAGHQAGQARALNSIGWTYGLLGEYEQALRYCGEAITLLTELGDRQGQAAAWDSLGYAHHRQGRYRRAVTCYRTALDLLQDIGARYKEAETWTNLGDAHESAGHAKAARTAWRRALEILTELGHREVDVVQARLDEHRLKPGGA